MSSERTRLVLVAIAMLGVGYALGARSAPPAFVAEIGIPPAPSPQDAAPVDTRTVDSILSALPAAAASASEAAPPRRDTTELLDRVKTLDATLASLARALGKPQDYRAASAVLDDLAAFEATSSRRSSLVKELAEDAAGLAPPPELAEGLRERARAIERTGALGLSVRGVPQDVTYLPVAAPSASGTEPTRFQGVALGADASGPRIVFRSSRGGVERKVEIFEDSKRHKDVARVSWSEKDGPVRLVRTAALAPAGETWRWFAERLWAKGAVEHDALEQLVARPLARPPRRAWIDWLRRHIDLPRNRDLGEEYGPPPPLTRLNPLLLMDSKARPASLDRADLVVDPERRDPPVALVGKGPFVLVASNCVAVYDNAWRWLVFDAAHRRVVDHAELAPATDSEANVEHVQWEFFPEPERFPQMRQGDLVDALQATSLERTRQAMSLLTLPGEVTDLGLELRRKVGGMLTQDGLEALRLRNEVLDRMRKLDALGHLLLDEDGSSHYERAHDRAKIETMVEIVDLIVKMIEEGRDGPSEYLLRDERVKTLLFHPPAGRTERDRLRKLFREKFRPWSVRFRRSFSGLATQWYEEDGG